MLNFSEYFETNEPSNNDFANVVAEIDFETIFGGILNLVVLCFMHLFFLFLFKI